MEFEIPGTHDGIIEIQLWEPHPDTPGILKLKGARTIGAVGDEIVARLKAEKDKDDPDHSLYGHLDYFHMGQLAGRAAHWPSTWQWIACFVVTGGSEGHYIHVEVIGGDQAHQRELLYVGKTFSGLEKALEISNFFTRILGA